MEAEDSLEDKTLQFFASERAHALTDLLQAYYEQAVDLEDKIANLNRQTQQAEMLVRLTEEEKPAVAALLPLFQALSAQYKADYAEHKAVVWAQLLPEKAKDLLADLETQTGRVVSIPPAITEQEKATFVEYAVDKLFDAQVKVLATNKWLSLFEQRHSRFGLDSEMGVYQDEISDIEANQHSLVRQQQRLQGHPPVALQDLGDADQPRNATERIRFLQGDIGLTRVERTEIRQDAALWAVIKFVVIIIIAFIVVQIVEFAVWRKLEKQADQAVPSLIRGLVAFLIYMLAAFAIVAFVFGQTVTSLLATSGVLAMIVGLAVQMNLSNIFSGVAVNLERPIRLGDFIKVGGYEGRIVNMNWRTTQIKTPMEEMVLIPNHTFAESMVVNVTHPYRDSWYGYTVHVPPQYDPDLIEKLLKEAIAAADVNGDYLAAEPWAQIAQVTDISAEYWAYAYLKDYGVRFEFGKLFWKAIIKRLKAENIPFSIHHYEQGLDWDAKPHKGFVRRFEGADE